MAKIWAIFALIPIFSGCAYRFTNVAMKPPAGVSSIAIEAIYDTSREVLPHEHLWAELQRAFAASGKVRVTGQKDADALVRAHIFKGDSTQSGFMGTKEPRDPLFKPGEAPPLPNKFRNMTESSHYADKMGVSFSVKVEIWDLNTRSLIKSATYGGGASLNSFRQTSAHGQFIMFEETVDNRIKMSMRSIAQQVVSDFFL